MRRLRFPALDKGAELTNWWDFIADWDDASRCKLKLTDQRDVGSIYGEIRKSLK